jgi:choline dehydrogenase-like flavoprotein
MQQIFSDVGLTSPGSSEWIGLLHHHIGTCRMATDPRAGVVDGNLKVHGTDNLFVVGSAPFVTSSAAPPTLSIVALALRLADHLGERLGGGSVT